MAATQCTKFNRRSKATEKSANTIGYSKHEIESTLNCIVEQVSGHVDYAEAATYFNTKWIPR